MVTGLPSTMTSVTALPRVLATTRVLPEAEGVGFSRSISMINLLFLISTVMGMGESFMGIWILIQSLLPIPRSQRMSQRLHFVDQPPGNSVDFIQVTVRAPHSGQGW